MEAAIKKATEFCAAGMSVRKSAVEANVPKNLLYKHLHDNFDRYAIMPPRGQLLYEHEEEELEKYALDCAARGFPLNITDLCEAAHKIVVACPRPTKGSSTRRLALSVRTPSGLTKASSNVSMESMSSWFKWFEDYLSRNNLLEVYKRDSRRVWNTDETPLSSSVKLGKVMGSKKARHLYKITQPNSKQVFTMLGTANAKGEFLRPFMILKGERITDELKAGIPDSVYFTLAKEGYETAETFLGKF